MHAFKPAPSTARRRRSAACRSWLTRDGLNARAFAIRYSSAPTAQARITKRWREMAEANPLWGAPRIHGELAKLGLSVSERTVSRLMPRRRRPPSQTWRTFLQNHASALVALDFFTVPTITGRVLFVLVVLAHERRRILDVNATTHPTSAWTRLQLREAFPWDVTPRLLLHDRDAIFDDAFRRSVAAVGLTDVRTAPRSPWQTPMWNA